MNNYETENNLLVVTAHGDDELKVAGTVLDFVDQGMNAYQVMLTDSSRGPDWRQAQRADAQQNAWIRKLEHTKASQLLGIKRSFGFRQRDLHLQPEDGLVLGLARMIQQLKPEVVIISDSDSHSDHIAANKIGLQALKDAAISVDVEGLDKPFRVPTIYQAEMMDPKTEVNMLVDVTRHKDRISEVMDAYASQMSPRLRSALDGARQWRGYQLNGPEDQVLLAEGFIVPTFLPSIAVRRKPNFVLGSHTNGHTSVIPASLDFVRA